MAMRNPSIVQNEILRRRMFKNPAVYNRNDPVGIMDSSPELRRAVMRNQSSVTDFMNQPVTYPASSNFGFPTEDDPNITIGGNTIGRGSGSSTTTGSNTTGGGPQQQNEVSVPLPESRPEGLGPKKNDDDPIVTAQELSDDPYKVVEKLLGGKKSIDDLVKKNKRLLDEYAPLAKKPDEKRRAFTDFFLRVAERGAEGDDLLAAAAKSGRPAVEGFTARKDAAEAKQEQRDMVALTLGLEEKKVQDAALQEAALKLLEDKDPATLKLAKALQEDAAARGENISLETAIQRSMRKTAPGFQLVAFNAIREKYPDLDPAIIVQIVGGGISLSDLGLGIGQIQDIQRIMDEILKGIGLEGIPEEVN